MKLGFLIACILCAIYSPAQARILPFNECATLHSMSDQSIMGVVPHCHSKPHGERIQRHETFVAESRWNGRICSTGPILWRLQGRAHHAPFLPANKTQSGDIMFAQNHQNQREHYRLAPIANKAVKSSNPSPLKSPAIYKPENCILRCSFLKWVSTLYSLNPSIIECSIFCIKYIGTTGDKPQKIDISRIILNATISRVCAAFFGKNRKIRASPDQLNPPVIRSPTPFLGFWHHPQCNYNINILLENLARLQPEN